MNRQLDLWAPYRPGPEAPWNRRRVVHLHRRAGFAASWPEIERDLNEGPEASITRVLEGKFRTGTATEGFSAVSSALAEAAITADNADRLKAWWVHRMLCGPDPLGERLTLLWHDHFATSNEKVSDLSAMRRQNDMFRSLARAPFGELLSAAVRDPALLVWLDAPANQKGHPNENLARELLELFSLGIGNYTEADVKEAARALAGWTVVDGVFLESAEGHDAGEKTIFGRKARWSGSDLIKALVEMPATALRLARRLCGLFFGEGAPDEAAVRTLAALLRGAGLTSAGESARSCGRAALLRRLEYPNASSLAGGLRHRRRNRPGTHRAASLDAGISRLDGPARSRPVLSAQRGGLARRALMAFVAFADRARESGVGPGRGSASRNSHGARSRRARHAASQGM